MTLSRDLIRRLPKAELHVHLDGCLRPQTMLELAREQRVSLPAADPEGLARAMYVREANSLEQYLERYRFTVAVMQTREALERVAYEFVLDSAADNVRYVEVRFCPALHGPRLTPAQAVEAVLAGLRRGEAETRITARLIVSALRTLPPAVSDELARVAVDYHGAGVVGFDLAGAERGHPAADHVAAFEHARAHGLPCTCHAGEGAGADSIRQALELCGAQRLGHGTRLFEDPELEAAVVERRIPLEVCLTSNLHTHTVTDLAEHPIRRYRERGCVVTLNTDSRLMDGTTLTDEYWLAHTRLGFDREALTDMMLDAVATAFLREEEKRALHARLVAELRETR